MAVPRRLVAIVAALLQFALPLASYARAPVTLVPGESDFCSATHPRSGHPPSAPAHDHAASHCALCAHGAPPALPPSPAMLPVVAAAVVDVVDVRGFAPVAVAHSRADARAPPRGFFRTT